MEKKDLSLVYALKEYARVNGKSGPIIEDNKCFTFDDIKAAFNAGRESVVEKIRWRAKKGYIYHRLNCYLRPESESDSYRTWNQKCHDSYNYFHTEEQTEEAARRVKETLRKYHEEIGE